MRGKELAHGMTRARAATVVAGADAVRRSSAPEAVDASRREGVALILESADAPVVVPTALVCAGRVPVVQREHIKWWRWGWQRGTILRYADFEHRMFKGLDARAQAAVASHSVEVPRVAARLQSAKFLDLGL